MEKAGASPIRRRDFLVTSSLLLPGAGLSARSGASEQPAARTPELKGELTPAEIEIVSGSVMAKDLDDYFGKGFNCAESALVVALRFLKKPEELAWAASGFGGGLGRKDLCGFLTAGAMAIGVYAGSLQQERKASKDLCGRRVAELWEWWAATAPLHCSEIREGRTDFRVCQRLGRLAAAKVEQLIRG